jgi:hypothetical protein
VSRMFLARGFLAVIAVAGSAACASRGIAGGDPSAIVGCYAIQPGAWERDEGFRRYVDPLFVPRFVQLLGERVPRWEPRPNDTIPLMVARPEPQHFFTTWRRIRTSSDTIRIGTYLPLAGVDLWVRPEGDRLRGIIRAFTDAIPPDGITEARVPVELVRVSCPHTERLGSLGENPSRASGTGARAAPEVGSTEGHTTTADPAACLAVGGAQVTGASVGDVRIREPEADVRMRCTVVADTSLLLEGEPQPALLLAIDTDIVLAEIVAGRVWRLRVRSPGLRASDSTGVGTPAHRLLSGDPDATVAWGAGDHYVISPSHCGMSFQLLGLPPRARPWTTAEVAQMPDSVRVGLVLVTGACHTPDGLRILWDTTTG